MVITTRSSRYEVLLKVCMTDLIIKKIGNRKFRRASKFSLDKRVRYLNRMVGKGALGFCDGRTTKARCRALVRAQRTYKVIGCVEYVTYSKTRPCEIDRVGVRNAQKDNWFECGTFYCDMPWLMEASAEFLDRCVYEGPQKRSPTYEEMRDNFGFFFGRIRKSLKVSARKVPAPAWCA